MGMKYIIEVEDKPFELLSEDGFTSEKLFRVKGFNSLVFDWNGLNMLTPYPEPDIEREQVRREAYEQGYHIGYSKYLNKSYEDGLKDSWDAARKIQDTGGNLNWWIHNVSPSEAIERLKQYEQYEEKQEEFYVGDEFETENGKKYVVLKMDGKEIDRYMDSDGRTYHMNVKYKVMRKTGRHFSEIAEVLKKIRGENND